MSLTAVAVGFVVALGVILYLAVTNKELSKRNSALARAQKEVLKRAFLHATKPTVEDVKVAQTELTTLEQADHEAKTQGILNRKK